MSSAENPRVPVRSKNGEQTRRPTVPRAPLSSSFLARSLSSLGQSRIAMQGSMNRRGDQVSSCISSASEQIGGNARGPSPSAVSRAAESSRTARGRREILHHLEPHLHHGERTRAARFDRPGFDGERQRSAIPNRHHQRPLIIGSRSVRPDCRARCRACDRGRKRGSSTAARPGVCDIIENAGLNKHGGAG